MISSKASFEHCKHLPDIPTCLRRTARSQKYRETTLRRWMPGQVEAAWLPGRSQHLAQDTHDQFVVLGLR
jgi:hypothetical protein